MRGISLSPDGALDVLNPLFMSFYLCYIEINYLKYFDVLITIFIIHTNIIKHAMINSRFFILIPLRRSRE